MSTKFKEIITRIKNDVAELEKLDIEDVDLDEARQQVKNAQISFYEVEYEFQQLSQAVDDLESCLKPRND